MSIIVKEVEKIWADGGENAIRDRRLQLIEEALKTAASESELKKEVEGLNKQLGDLLGLFRRLEKSKADKTELHTHTPSALEVKASSSEAKKIDQGKPANWPGGVVDEPKEPSFLSEVLALWNKRNKK